MSAIIPSIPWEPTATIETLKQRAQIIALIRQFFAERSVLEVETPILSHAAGTDPYIQSMTVNMATNELLYMQTSPEFAMKRLLAAGSGSIYQLCKSFRGDECGRHHNPEFTMLEWYRIDFDHHQLMDEMDALLQRILKTKPAERLTYQQAFEKLVGIHPHLTSVAELEQAAQQHHLSIPDHVNRNDPNLWLQLLMSDVVEPNLGQEQPTFIYDYPASQASLARIRVEKNFSVAERFEVYFKGMELANGFHELADAAEQKRRFDHEQTKRHTENLPPVTIDQRFLAALEHGLPHCAGVALGIDRLIMLALEQSAIKNVISFDFNRA